MSEKLSVRRSVVPSGRTTGRNPRSILLPPEADESMALASPERRWRGVGGVVRWSIPLKGGTHGNIRGGDPRQQGGQALDAGGL